MLAYYYPMKDWVRAHPYQALVLGYVLYYVLTTALWVSVGHPLEDALITAFMWTLSYGFVAYIGVRRRLKAKARLEEQGQVMAYVRYPDSPPGSLSSTWNQGIATPSAGSIHFQPAVYDTLEPSGRATTITVEDLLPERRKVTGKDRKYIQGYWLQAMTLVTENGKVEIAGSPESLDKLSRFLECG
jgi:hypothetical protein